MTWQPSAWQPLTDDLVAMIFLQQSVFWATILFCDSGCWLGTGGHKESPPDGQYLDWTDILWHLQAKKVRVRLLFSFHAVTDLAG